MQFFKGNIFSPATLYSNEQLLLFGFITFASKPIYRFKPSNLFTYASKRSLTELGKIRTVINKRHHQNFKTAHHEDRVRAIHIRHYTHQPAIFWHQLASTNTSNQHGQSNNSSRVNGHTNSAKGQSTNSSSANGQLTNNRSANGQLTNSSKTNDQ